MLNFISTLFKERGQLIVKQLNLAKKLHAEYVPKEVPMHLRNYKSLAELQNDIGQKEKIIVDLIHKRTVNNELFFMHMNQK